MTYIAIYIIFNSRLIGQLVVSEETEKPVGQMELSTMTSIHPLQAPHNTG